MCPEVTEEGRMISVTIRGLQKRKIQRKKGDVSMAGWKQRSLGLYRKVIARHNESLEFHTVSFN